MVDSLLLRGRSYRLVFSGASLLCHTDSVTAATDKVLVPGFAADRTKVSCAEVARVFLVSAEHVRRLCEDGAIAAEPVADRNPRSVNYWRIPITALADFIQSRVIHGECKPTAKRMKRACTRRA